MNHAIHPFGGAQGKRIIGAGRLVVVLSWAFFLAFAWFTTQHPQPGKPGRLAIINPSYRWLSLASAAALVLVGAALLSALRDKRAHHHDGACNHEDEDSHDHKDAGLAASCCQEAPSPGELVFQALFLAPIVLSLCTTGSGLSGTSLARRGIHEIPLSGQTGTGRATPTTPSPATAEAQAPLSMADLHEYLLMGAPPQLAGRQVDLIGQYFVDERCGENQFVVTRIVVTCCLADAEVIGLRAQSSKPFKPNPGAAANSTQSPQGIAAPGAHGLTKLGPWVAVSGRLKILNDRFGNPALFVDNATVSEVPPPEDILLYPRRRAVSW